MTRVVSLLVCMVFCLVAIVSYGEDSFDVGVFYYPGWKDNQKGAAFKRPWEVIKPYAKLEPTIGWYNDGDIDVTERQIDMMADFGIDYVVYQYFWGEDGRPFMDHAIQSFLLASNNNRVRFSVLWANPDRRKVPNTIDNYRAMILELVANYFKHPRYYKIDGKPVIYIFSLSSLRDRARDMGVSAKYLLDMARSIAIAHGLKGIYFIGCLEADDHWLKFAQDSGFDAISGFNYHRAVSGSLSGASRFSHSYSELMNGYAIQWGYILEHSALPYIIPVSSGWDRRPWGGSKDPLHDLSEGTPELFREHFEQAVKVMRRYEKAAKNIVVCCWNEYGEGSYIEPTRYHGYKYLQVIKDGKLGDR